MHSVKGQSLEVISFNIRYDNPGDGLDRWDRRKGAVANLLYYYSPVVFGLQEALNHQLEYIDNRLTTYTYVGVGRDDGAEKGEYSPVFYDSTRLKVLQQATFWLSEHPEEISVGWDASMERICTYALLEEKGSLQKFWVFNTHFDHRGDTARFKSAELILKKISALNQGNYPVILMGDFNATPDSPPIKAIVAQIQDAAMIAEQPLYGPLGTFNGFDKAAPLEDRIDYIFTSGVSVDKYAHLDDRYGDHRFISDHLPVYVLLSW
jgi:endonuclease/exonuclease/phosphatase family metal-dependent hydrolase